MSCCHPGVRPSDPFSDPRKPSDEREKASHEAPEEAGAEGCHDEDREEARAAVG